jgi:FMN phosphatase YigB (HAD superfamily)
VLTSNTVLSSRRIAHDAVDPAVAERLSARIATDGSLRSPCDPTRRIRAVLFDVDGTLYRQRPLRLRMAVELGTLAFTRPLRAPSVWRALTEYRKAQETLRTQRDGADVGSQISVAAERAGMTATDVAAIVDEWMIERPLKYLPECRAHGLVELLDFLRAQRIRLGILSDYPAVKKLEALGIGHYFSLVLCGGDPEIAAFKPNPRGFLAASAQWHLDPSEILYVGDRPDADAAGAAAANMPAAIVTDSHIPDSTGVLSVSSLERLRHVLDDDNNNSR